MKSRCSERWMRRIFKGLGILGMAWMVPACGSKWVEQAPVPPTPGGGGLAKQVLAEGNRVRQSQGKSSLSTDVVLDRAAEHQARFLAGNVANYAAFNGAIAHHRFAARSAEVSREGKFGMTAEIAAAMPGAMANAPTVVQTWMNSGGHRGKLLGSWSKTGVGAAKGRDGTWYLVQWFGQ